MSATKIFVSVRDRFQCTVDCVESLIATTRECADICIFDNGSGPELPDLLCKYSEWIFKGQVAQVVLNGPGALRGAYWSKNFSWSQFLSGLRLIDPSERDFAVMVDNDVIAKPGWLPSCLSVLKSPSAKTDKITVASPYDEMPRYDDKGGVTRERIGRHDQYNGVPCIVRSRLTSRFWVAAYEFWASFDFPPHKQILRNGRMDRYPTDNWYYEKMIQRGYRFAVLENPLACDPEGSWPSARMSNGIGADAVKK